MLLSFPLKGWTTPDLWLKKIIIDPGHGGEDPGAISPEFHVQEKEVNMNIAEYLSGLLKQHLPFLKVIKTRNKDVFVPLGDRTAIANQDIDHNAVFISIHTNSHNSKKKVEGIEVFYHYQSNEAIAMFRKKEFLKKIKINNKVIKSALVEVINSRVKEESKKFAEIVAEKLKLATNEPIRKVVASNLYVVSYSIIPSILVEVGFINSAKWLSKKYQEKVAKGIFLGILSYIKEGQKN